MRMEKIPHEMNNFTVDIQTFYRNYMQNIISEQLFENSFDKYFLSVFQVAHFHEHRSKSRIRSNSARLFPLNCNHVRN